jgi:hypothetical protein
MALPDHLLDAIQILAILALFLIFGHQVHFLFILQNQIILSFNENTQKS